MEVESSFRPEDVEARGAMCVECLCALAAGAAVLDRCGAALCRACAAEFYAACAGCARLVPRDEGLTRPEDAAGVGALFCVECFRAPAGDAEPPPSDEEVERLVARYVALHAEKKQLDDEMEEIKERLKLAAGARSRVTNAVVLRAGEGAVRCSYSVRTTWDAAKLSEAEALLGPDEFSSLFERKVSYAAVRERLAEFLAGTGDAHTPARELVRAAEQSAETVTLGVVAPKKKKKPADS
ncbi:MAG TPA: hypothetical protein VF240_00490 [Pyrinomonadaceae bacterium]